MPVLSSVFLVCSGRSGGKDTMQPSEYLSSLVCLQ